MFLLHKYDILQSFVKCTRVHNFHNILVLYGLKGDAQYKDTTHNVVYSGAYLMQHGMPVTLAGDYDSHMIHLVAAASM